MYLVIESLQQEAQTQSYNDEYHKGKPKRL